MNMEQTVWDWVSLDPFGYGYLLDFYRRGAQVCWADDQGLALRDERCHITYVGGTVPEDLAALHSPGLLLTDNGVLAGYLDKTHPEWTLGAFSQAYYLKREPPEVPLRSGISLRPLTLADMDFVLENYHNPGAYESHIRGRIAEGMVGGLVDGELAGFAGIHQEGAMGMLEVLPQFRRRGLAEALEAAIIAMQLRRGRFPYCHVRLGNLASETLQEKLGLVFDRRRTLFWLG